MLLDKFFNIHERFVTDKNAVFVIDLNADHAVFKGHFPGQPVVPGVCMLQIIKELTGLLVNKKLQLKKASQLKFLAVINPLESPRVTVEFTYENLEAGEVMVTGKIFKESSIFLKFKGSFILSNTGEAVP